MNKAIGILGDIGSGKSFVAKQFGYPVFNADKEVIKIYKENKSCFKKLRNKLPKYIKSYPINKVELMEADFIKNSSQQHIKNYFKSKVDVVLSDMAENTTGIKNVDSISTGELCKEAMYFAKDILKENGVFVCKIFMGSTFNEIITYSREVFNEVNIFKPPASKKDSKENFIICKKIR